MPKDVYHAYGYVKKAAAVVNPDPPGACRLEGAMPIVAVADEVIGGAARCRVPAVRVADRVRNAVEHERERGDLEPRASSWLGGKLGWQEPVHPNDHVNMGQSSNDTFPTAMHIAAVTMARRRRMTPALTRLRDAIAVQGRRSGRTS